MTVKDILQQLPYGKTFRFVDELLRIDDDGVVGSYTYGKDLYFYQGHFREHPVTPAVILTETMAQIGLVCLGIYLLRDAPIGPEIGVAMTSSAVDFLKPVFPGERVLVFSEKNYFRFNKLQCKVRMENADGEVVCKGTIAGMLILRSNGSK